MQKKENVYIPDYDLDESSFESKRVYALWILLADRLKYKIGCSDLCVDISACNRLFTKDPIAYDVLLCILKKKPNAESINVMQLNNIYEKRSSKDTMEILKSLEDPEIVALEGSDFLVFVSKKSNDLEVLFFDISRYLKCV